MFVGALFQSCRRNNAIHFLSLSLPHTLLHKWAWSLKNLFFKSLTVHLGRSGKLKRRNAPVHGFLKQSQGSTLNVVVISQQWHGVQRTTVVFRSGGVHQTLVHLQQPLQPRQREQKSRQEQGLPYQDQNETVSLFTGQCHSNTFQSAGNGILDTKEGLLLLGRLRMWFTQLGHVPKHVTFP